MALETSFLLDCAVVWFRRSGRSGIDSFGRPIVSAAVQLPCRFEYITRLDQNVQEIADLIVAKFWVAVDIPTQSIVWDGKLSQLPDDLADIQNLMHLVDFAKTPDIKNRAILRMATLARYHDTLPTIGT